MAATTQQNPTATAARRRMRLARVLDGNCEDLAARVLDLRSARVALRDGDGDTFLAAAEEALTAMEPVVLNVRGAREAFAEEVAA